MAIATSIMDGTRLVDTDDAELNAGAEVVVSAAEEMLVGSAVAAALVRVVAVAVGTTNVPLPGTEVAFRVPKPIWALSKSKTEYTFFKKTSPTSQTSGPEESCEMIVETQPEP